MDDDDTTVMRSGVVPFAIVGVALAVAVGAGVVGYRWISAPVPSLAPAAGSPSYGDAPQPVQQPAPDVPIASSEAGPKPPVEEKSPPAAAPAATVAAPPALDPDDELWRVASQRDSPSAYEAYLKRFPRGKHATSAQVMLDSRQPKAVAPATSAAPPVARAPEANQVAGSGAAPAKPDGKPAQPLPDTKVAAQLPPQAPPGGAQASGAVTANRGASAAKSAGKPAGKEAAAEGAKKDTLAATQLAGAGPAGAGSPSQPAAKPAEKDAAAAGSARKDASKDDVVAALTPSPSGPEARTIRLPDQVMTGDFTPDPNTGIVSGTGQIVWSNGNRFEGRLVKGVKEGKGRYVWANGQRYSGDWAADAPNGRGVLEFSNGNRYDGEVRNGLPHGVGTLKFSSGDVYSGGWQRGKQHGNGRYTWSNGIYWEGEFREDRTTENGKTVFADGRTIAGAAGRTAAAPGPSGQDAGEKQVTGDSSR